MVVINYIVGIFETPSIFISLIACVGLIIQKKSVTDIIKGTFKCMLGIIILNEGVSMMQACMTPLTTAFGSLTPSGNGAQLADYGAFMGEFGMQMGIIMCLGFVCNMLIARFTPLKTIYLTGHMMMFYSMLWLGLGVESGFSGGKLIVFALIGYLLSITITPQLLKKDMIKLTGKWEFSIGHSGTLWCLLAGRVGQLMAKTYKSPEDIKSMEKLKIPKKVEFLRDTSLVTGLLMVIVYVVITLAVGPELRAEIGATNVFSFCLTEGMQFGAGIVILLMGCRMMMAEIIPAFTGISKKIVPGAVPALDIPMIYPYGPTSLMIGYMFALAASVGAMVVLNVSGLSPYVLVPLTAAVYFDVSSGCIFANAYGGKRGVIAWGIIGGIGIMIVTAVAMPLVANTVGTFVQTMGFSECSIWVIIVGYITKIFIH